MSKNRVELTLTLAEVKVAMQEYLERRYVSTHVPEVTAVRLEESYPSPYLVIEAFTPSADEETEV